MRVRLRRGPPRVAAATCMVAFAVGWLAGCTGRAASDPTRGSQPTDARGGAEVRVLQMNLCNSGRADCYAGGRAVGIAAAVIHEHRPGVVSLNEVCRDDVRALEQAMSAASAATRIASAFASAKDPQTRAPVRCRGGQEYGDAVLVAVPRQDIAPRIYSGVYPVQDPRDMEERVWVCLDLPARLSACTTHTSSTDASVALSQCRYLLSSALPTLGRGGALGPIVLGADLNLSAGDSPGPDSCLPSGYQRTDDGGRQDVVISPAMSIRARAVIDMQGTTDHPGLLVDVVVPHD